MALPCYISAVIYVYIYICIYVCMFVHACVRTYVRMHVLRMYVYIYLHMYIYTYIHTYMYICKLVFLSYIPHGSFVNSVTLKTVKDNVVAYQKIRIFTYRVPVTCYCT